MELQPYQKRVVDEKSELDSKIAALSAFIGTDVFNGLDGAEQLRQNLQLGYMQLYSQTLGARISNFIS